MPKAKAAGVSLERQIRLLRQEVKALEHARAVARQDWNYSEKQRHELQVEYTTLADQNRTLHAELQETCKQYIVLHNAMMEYLNVREGFNVAYNKQFLPFAQKCNEKMPKQSQTPAENPNRATNNHGR